MPVDLTPATRHLSELIVAVPGELLSGPTPCPDWSVADLLDHVGGFAHAFTAGARKKTGDEPGGSGPSVDGRRLGDDWRSRIPRDLAALAEAWSDPEAWTGVTRVAGVDLSGEMAGLFALDEVVVHGWDLARSTGQPYTVGAVEAQAVYDLVAPLAQPRQETPNGIFGPPVTVSGDAPLLDRVIGLTGRDPAWSPA